MKIHCTNCNTNQELENFRHYENGGINLCCINCLLALTPEIHITEQNDLQIYLTPLGQYEITVTSRGVVELESPIYARLHTNIYDLINDPILRTPEFIKYLGPITQHFEDKTNGPK